MSNPGINEKLDETPKPSRWPKRVVICGLVLLPIVVLASAYIIIEIGGAWALREAMDEADRLDPGWRLLELEAKRKEIPDADNSAKFILSVIGPEGRPTGAIPRSWPSDDLNKRLEDLDPTTRPNEQQLKILRDELAKVSFALSQLRKLTDMPDGRYPITYGRMGIDTLLPHLQGSRTVAGLLAYDAMLRAEEGQMDAALASCQAGLHAGRSLGDEPIVYSMLVRTACHYEVFRALERVLAQGQASEAALAALQQLIQTEAAQPFLLQGIRGERASLDRCMEALERGEISAADLVVKMDWEGHFSQLTYIPLVDIFIYTWTAPFKYGSEKQIRADVLRCTTQLVEMAKLPVEQQAAEMKRVAAAFDEPFFVREFVASGSRVMGAYHLAVARLRTATALLAAERYRLAKGRWPGSLNDLTPSYLTAAPIDPFDGKPLKCLRRPDGIIIYSVGPDGKNDSGKLDRNRRGYSLGGTDLGFQLWDVDKRRQPPVPPSTKPSGSAPP